MAYDIAISDVLPLQTTGSGYQANHSIVSLAPGATWTYHYDTILDTDVIY